MFAPIRVGAVSYLNAKPLYYRLGEFAPEIRLEMDLPEPSGRSARCRDARPGASFPRSNTSEARRRATRSCRGLRSRRRALFGALNCFRGCLAADRTARPRRRFANKPGAAQVWLDARHGEQPRKIDPLPMGVPIEECMADAVLLIGDRAMTVSHEPYHEVVNLGQAWNEFTGLPFVFALWVARPGLDLGDLPRGTAALPGQGPCSCRRPGERVRSQARPRLHKLLRLPHQRPLLRPRRAGSGWA